MPISPNRNGLAKSQNLMVKFEEIFMAMMSYLTLPASMWSQYLKSISHILDRVQQSS